MKDQNKMKVVFSVDTERPFAGADEGVFDFLNLLDLHRIPATFFVVGEVGEARPDIVDAIHASGHEVACHNWDHPNIGVAQADRAPFVDELGPDALRWRFERCREVLTRDGQSLRGFRAPWFRIGSTGLSVVGEFFSYDSSFTARRMTEIKWPRGLRELPVSTFTNVGPRLGTSFFFGPGALKSVLKWLRYAQPDGPLMLFSHSFDLRPCPTGLSTAAWKRLWYFNRCGRERVSDLAMLFTALKDCGYEFARAEDLLPEKKWLV